MSAVFLTLLLSASARADCEESVNSADLLLLLERAEHSYSVLDEAAFMAFSDTLRADLVCVEELMSRSIAARIHRLEGLRAFLDRDASASALSFAAARSIEPEYEFPESLLPAQHPIRMEYEAFPLTAGRWETLAPPERIALWFDGRPSDQRPETWPTLLQQVNELGAVLSTALLQPGEPVTMAALPEPTTPEASVEAPPELPQERLLDRPALRWGALGTGVVAGVAAGSFYALASRADATYWDRELGTSDSELAELQADINRNTILGGVSTGLAVAGVAGFVVLSF